MNIEKFVTDIKFNLMRSHYWYASVIMQMPVVYDDPAVDTFAVGIRNARDSLVSLFICSSYVETVVELCHNDRAKLLDHFTEVLKHEVHHIIFGHLTLDLPNNELKNIACELSANSFIDRKRLIPTDPDIPPGVFPEDFDFEPKLGVREYYDLLLKKLKTGNISQGQTIQGQIIQGQTSQGQTSQGQTSQGQTSQGQTSQGQTSQGQNTETYSLDSHGKWQGIQNSQMMQIAIQAMVRNANRAARESGRSYGNISGDLLDIIQMYDQDEPPVIPWEIVLKNFLASASETVLDYTMRRPSKRYGTRPGTRKEDILSIAIGIDTSGSISQDELQLFFNELYWIEKTGSRMTVFEWDTKILREYDFKDYDGTVSDGGGTDPTDFLETVSLRKYDCAIIFTDLGFAPVRKDYHLPMLWVATSDLDWQNELPVQGTILKVNKSRDGFQLLRQ